MGDGALAWAGSGGHSGRRHLHTLSPQALLSSVLRLVNTEARGGGGKTYPVSHTVLVAERGPEPRSLSYTSTFTEAVGLLP